MMFIIYYRVRPRRYSSLALLCYYCRCV